MKNLAVISIQIDEEPLSEIYDPQKIINVHYKQQFIKDISFES